MALSQLCWVTGKSKGSVSCWSTERCWQQALAVAPASCQDMLRLAGIGWDGGRPDPPQGACLPWALPQRECQGESPTRCQAAAALLNVTLGACQRWKRFAGDKRWGCGGAVPPARDLLRRR